MIVGISGKIGSGKDTVGKIIQYLVMDKKYPSDTATRTYNDFIIAPKDYQEEIWQIKKFAGKLKQCVSIITGIPIEDLEKEEVKNNYLGEEWTKTYRNPLCSPNANCEGGDCNPCYKLTIGFNKTITERLTVRKLLQLFGTEVGRQIHSNTWVNALFSEYVLEKYHSGKLDKDGNAILKDDYPKWIITDVRFPNEVKAIKDRNGIIIRVNSDNIKYADGSYRARNDMLGDNHISETALDNYSFNYIINNNGTIDELITNVKDILIR